MTKVKAPAHFQLVSSVKGPFQKNFQVRKGNDFFEENAHDAPADDRTWPVNQGGRSLKTDQVYWCLGF